MVDESRHLGEAVSLPKSFSFTPSYLLQLAARSVAGSHELDGAHCLKYGATTNNLLGASASSPRTARSWISVRRRRAGHRPSRPRLRLRGPARIDEAAARSLRVGRRSAAGPVRVSRVSRTRTRLIISAGIVPVAMKMDKPADPHLRELRDVGAIRLTVEAMLIIEVEGSDAEDRGECWPRIRAIAQATTCARESMLAMEAAEIWQGAQVGLRLTGNSRRLIQSHWTARCRPASCPGARAPAADLRLVRVRVAKCSSCRRRQHASVVLYNINANRSGSAEEAGAAIIAAPASSALTRSCSSLML